MGSGFRYGCGVTAVSCRSVGDERMVPEKGDKEERDTERGDAVCLRSEEGGRSGRAAIQRRRKKDEEGEMGKGDVNGGFWFCVVGCFPAGKGGRDRVWFVLVGEERGEAAAAVKLFASEKKRREIERGLALAVLRPILAGNDGKR
ncbi:hypothetical protein HAX54_013008 [Datura stramonium]|uniref:Uncharacterized protein n=1 Tax=Datura stramonium TaxID=4076 RepID=A0ABS8TM72_DATST|nr:hypothetical protein [Datura stramonium]